MARLPADKQATAATRLALMRRGKREVRDATWPGTHLPVKLVVLSCSEVQECHAEAIARFERLRIPLDVYSVQLFQDELLTQVLFRGCRDPEDIDQPFAESADDLRDNTTVDERAAVYDVYRDFQASVDPAPGEMDQELLETILDLVKKKDGARLKAIGLSGLVSFLLTTGDRLST